MVDVMDRRREHRRHHLGGGSEHQLHHGNQFDHLQRREDGLQSRGVEQGVHGEGDVGRVATVVVWHLKKDTLVLLHFPLW